MHTFPINPIGEYKIQKCALLNPTSSVTEDSHPKATAWAEPDIVINGVRLTYAQSMMLRVALGDFFVTLSDDEHMQALGDIGPLYLARAREVSKIMSMHRGTTA